STQPLPPACHSPISSGSRDYDVKNPLAETAAYEPEDRRLVRQAQRGSRAALEQLITRHQAWIYNIVLRMVYLPQDAEDATQEILVKLLSNQRWSWSDANTRDSLDGLRVRDLVQPDNPLGRRLSAGNHR